MTKKKPKRDLMMFRIRPDVPSDLELQRRLRRASQITGTPMSQLMREATEQKLRELAKRYPELAAA